MPHPPNSILEMFWKSDNYSIHYIILKILIDLFLCIPVCWFDKFYKFFNFKSFKKQIDKIKFNYPV